MKKDSIFRLLLAVLFTVTFVSYSYGFSIKGSVTDTKGKPIANAFIEAMTPTYGLVAYGFTDKEGNYSLDNKTYTDKAFIYAQALGYLGEYYYQNDNKPNLSDRMKLVESNKTINFALRKGIARVEAIQVIVWNDKLNINFNVFPGFIDMLKSVILIRPDGSTYTFDLKKGFVDASTDCIRSAKWWDYTFDNSYIEYGKYTFNFIFNDGYSVAYTKYLKENSELKPIESSDISVTIEDKGSAKIKWNVVDNQYYRLKVKGKDGIKYYFTTPSFLALKSVALENGNLACLKVGENYRWAVSTYDTFPYPPNIVVSPVNKGYQAFALQKYNPSHLKDIIAWFGAWNWNNKLDLGFDVRSGSRDNIKSATVITPDSNIYSFNLKKDWKNLSTDDNMNEGFDLIIPDDSPINGTYDLVVKFKDNSTMHSSFDYESRNETVLNVSGDSMKAYPDKFGGVTFAWVLPKGAEKQYYDVRIRSLDNKKEYIRKMVKDTNYIYFSPWELKGLKPNTKYIWLIQIWSNDLTKGIETVHKEFEYKQ